MDLALGTDYYNANVPRGRLIKSCVTEAVRIAEKHQLGVLVFDDIQNSGNARSGSTDRIMGFLKMLMNSAGVPVVVIGTPAAESILSKDFQLAHRVSGLGSIYWGAMERGSAEWKTFTDVLWIYQWTKKQVPLTDRMRDALYDECQGIAVLAVLLYREVQLDAVSGHRETFDPESFGGLLQKHFFYMVPVIRVRRDKDQDVLSRYEDIAFELLREEVRYPEKERRILQEEVRARKERLITEITVERLKDFDVPPKKARHYTMEAVSQGGSPERYAYTAMKLYILEEEMRKAGKTKKAKGSPG